MGKLPTLRPVIIPFLITLSILALVIFYYFSSLRDSPDIYAIRRLAVSGDEEELANLLDLSMVRIPAGEFSMGSDLDRDDEKPLRQVYLNAFEIDRYEVTNSQYLLFTLATETTLPRYWVDGKFPLGQADYPVVGVSWENAQSYCKWVGKRLPTEAEWEKACRGLQGKIYPWGDQWDARRANVGFDQTSNWPLSLEEGWKLLENEGAAAGIPSLTPVGHFPRGASTFGIYDMVGNVSEWVADWYNWEGYWDLPMVNPIGLGPRWNHSIRGSAWFDRRGQEGEIANSSRCSARNSSHSFDDPRVGFRCVR